jgi:L-serine/L-threonine ammonia-lyase
MTNYAIVPIVALETKGSNCFYQSVLANPSERDGRAEAIRATKTSAYTPDVNHGVIISHLARLDSRAKCLGASSPAAGVVKMALDRQGTVKCVCVPDEMSMRAAVEFAGKHFLHASSCILLSV